MTLPKFVRRPVFAVLLLTLFGAMVCARLGLMLDYSAMLDCGRCLVYPSLWSELQLLLGLACLDLAARRWLGRGAWVARVLLLLCLLLWVLDWWVLKSFLVRLDWREARKFWGEMDSAAFFVEMQARRGAGALAATALVVVAVLAMALGYAVQALPRPAAWLPASLLMLLVLSVWLAPARPYHYSYVRNALVAFLDPPTLYNNYAPDWAAQQGPRLRHAANEQVCLPPRDAAPRPERVVLVLVESLSSYQSRAFGGIHDWTPQLDRWSEKGRRLSHFLANGKTTEEGLFSLLTGRAPLQQPGLTTIYQSQLDPARPALPQVMASAGYVTGFLTTGNLGFMDKGAWLQRTGFEDISGHDDPFYEGMPRYHFDAASDEALYARAQQWMHARAGQSYFLVLETVSTHQPYFDPVRQKPSIEGAFRYADAALGRFLDQLQAQGFLDEGLVMVTGDHRAMVPASAHEVAQMGEDHLSRIPMLLLGKSADAMQEDGYFSQQDVQPFLQQLTGEPTCLHPGQGVWTAGHARPAQCIFMLQAPQPDSVFLRCGQDMREIRLNAEHTRYVGAPGPQSYLDAVHVQRMPVFQAASDGMPQVVHNSKGAPD